MESITSKIVVRQLADDLTNCYANEGKDAFIRALENTLLNKKVRFPLLEHAAERLLSSLPESVHDDILDTLIDHGLLGSYVIVGMALQTRLGSRLEDSFSKAARYIIRGDQWYVCDIIGERVMGHGLLTCPREAIPLLEAFTKHPDKWIVRSVGVATHYAVKKGLQKQYSDDMFRLLLTLADVTEFHTKKGVGWAAKTIAKFHPDIIERYREQTDSPYVRQWFRTKITIGSGRAWKYAGRHTG